MKKILIVDDDKELLQALSIRLKASGYTTVFATDANSAIMITRKEKPDLILLDIGLPGGDGFMIMERLRDITLLSSIPIIVLTAKDPSITMEKALKAGAKAFFHKPPDNTDFLNAIRKALHESGSSVRKKILLVDGDKELQTIIADRLSSSGYDVVFGNDVLSGTIVAKRETPDLVIIEIMLPGGNGFMLMKQLQNIMPTVPVIVFTGKSSEAYEEQSLHAGAAAFLKKPEDVTKPFSTIQLLAAIRRAFDAISDSA